MMILLTYERRDYEAFNRIGKNIVGQTQKSTKKKQLQ